MPFTNQTLHNHTLPHQKVSVAHPSKAAAKLPPQLAAWGHDQSLSISTERNRSDLRTTHSLSMCHADAVVQQTSKSSAGQSQAFRQSQCPFAGSSSPHSLKQPLPSTSTPDDSNPLGLSVTSPSRDYLPFKDEAYTIDLKMDRIAHDDIFELDEEYEADMKRKAHILSTRPTEMLLPGVPGVSKDDSCMCVLP